MSPPVGGGRESPPPRPVAGVGRVDGHGWPTLRGRGGGEAAGGFRYPAPAPAPARDAGALGAPPTRGGG